MTYEYIKLLEKATLKMQAHLRRKMQLAKYQSLKTQMEFKFRYFREFKVLLSAKAHQ